jgi:hypothetical protein
MLKTPFVFKFNQDYTKQIKTMKKLLVLVAFVVSSLTALTSQAQEACVTTFTDGSFSVGVKVTFETLANGTDVKASFELLDTNLIAELGFIRDAGEPINQRDMTKDDTNKFSIVLTNQTGTISHRFYMVIQGGGDRLTQPIDYTVGSDCSGTNDKEVPTDFTAEVGEVTAFAVEFLLNGKDNSGTVAYYITVNGSTTAVSGASDVPTTLIVSGLNPDTNYSFSIVAEDLAGNALAPIVIEASTGMDASTPCAGTGFDNDPRFPPFAIGYAYTFETLPSGTEVEITWELLDNRNLAAVNLWSAAPPDGPEFIETPMTLVSGKKYTATVSGLTEGQVIKYQCLFIAEGGALVPVLQEYTVGDDCFLGVNDLELSKFKVFPNPAKDSWTVNANNINISSIKIFDLLGKNVMTLTPNSSTVKIDGTSLKIGLYFAQIKTVSGLTSLKLVKK